MARGGGIESINLITRFRYSLHLLADHQSENMSAVNNELALFQPAAKENAVSEVDWINFRPLGQISKGSTITFQIPGTSSEYILLSKTRLHVKLRILKSDGNPITSSDNVGLINLSLHSLFRQVDVKLQQQVITTTVGVNYPYKAILDVLLQHGHDVKDSLLQSEGYYKDTASFMDSLTSNTGHLQRKQLTKAGIADFEGVLHIDVAQQPRAILNGVQIHVSLFQNDDNFRLMSDGTAYEVEITDCVLKVCHLRLNPSVVLAHNERLKRSPAIYPFWRSNVKTFGISSGSYTFSVDDIFHGVVPNKLIVGFVSSSAYSGDFTKNPFNFQHFNLNFLELSVDGRSVPTVPFTPSYEIDTGSVPVQNLHTGYINEYLSLFDYDYPQKQANWISRGDYNDGYTIYVFNTKPGTSKDLFSAVTTGHTRLSARFDSGLAGPVTAIVYGVFPDQFGIDQTRNVIQ